MIEKLKKEYLFLMLMAIPYVNTGTALGALPKINRDVNPDFTKPPTGVFEYLLFNLRGMERVFDGITTMAAERYPRVFVMVPDQYVTNEFAQESAEKNRCQGRSSVDSILLSGLIPTNSANNSELNSKGRADINLRDSNRTYNQLYKLYQQAFELYNRISGNTRSHANQVYNSTVEAFKKLRQGTYAKDVEGRVQDGYKPNLRTKVRDNAKRVLVYVRNNWTGYLGKIKKQHLPVQDLSIKGLEALLQEA